MNTTVMSSAVVHRCGLFLFLLCLYALSSCKKSNPNAPLPSIQKTWIANKVTEGSMLVYTRGTGGNIKQGYDNFRLELSPSGTVLFTELDGHNSTGQWEHNSNAKTLTLKNLTPPPSGTNGIVSYQIEELNDDQLFLRRTDMSEKTGGTINTYQLIKR
jgi:hypothetical protein